MKTKTPKGETMKARALYLDDELWQALRFRALEERTTVTGIARELFRAYLAKPARKARTVKAAAALFLLLAGAAHAATLGRYTSPDGSIYFGSNPPAGAVLAATYAPPATPSPGTRVMAGASSALQSIGDGLGEIFSHPRNCPSCGPVRK